MLDVFSIDVCVSAEISNSQPPVEQGTLRLNEYITEHMDVFITHNGVVKVISKETPSRTFEELFNILESVQNSYEYEFDDSHVEKVFVKCESDLSRNEFENLAKNGKGTYEYTGVSASTKVDNIEVTWYNSGTISVTRVEKYPYRVDEYLDSLLSLVEEEILV